MFFKSKKIRTEEKDEIIATLSNENRKLRIENHAYEKQANALADTKKQYEALLYGVDELRDRYEEKLKTLDKLTSEYEKELKKIIGMVEKGG